MNPTTYTTRDINKGLAIVGALIAAGHHTQMTTGSSHGNTAPTGIVIVTNATPAQFAAVRMGLSDIFPSSNTNATLDMPNPDTITIPDTMPTDWS